MPRRSVSVAVALAVASLAVGCATPDTPTSIRNALPMSDAGSAPAAATPAQAPAPSAAWLEGRAAIDGKAFGGATVTAYRLGTAAPVATGTVDASGHFRLAPGEAVPEGALLKLVAVRADETLVTLAAAPPSVVAAGGANVVAAGGANVVAAGGANVVAAGGANWGARTVMGAKAAPAPKPTPAIELSLTTTVSYLLLNKRWEAAGQAAVTASGSVVSSLAEATLGNFNKLAGVVTAVAQSPDLKAQVTKLQGPPESVVLPTIVIDRLVAAEPTLPATFSRVAIDIKIDIEVAIKVGGAKPAAALLGRITIGVLVAAPVQAPRGSDESTEDGSGELDVVDGEVEDTTEPEAARIGP
jgi:hypothetical protein